MMVGGEVRAVLLPSVGSYNWTINLEWENEGWTHANPLDLKSFGFFRRTFLRNCMNGGRNSLPLEELGCFIFNRHSSFWKIKSRNRTRIPLEIFSKKKRNWIVRFRRIWYRVWGRDFWINWIFKKRGWFKNLFIENNMRKSTGTKNLELSGSKMENAIRVSSTKMPSSIVKETN